MRLVDLDPRWLILQGRRVGFIFISPTNPKYRQTCFVEKLPLFTCAACKDVDRWSCDHSQMGAIRQSCADLLTDDDGWASNVQLCRKDFAWVSTPPLAQTSFDAVSITPSIDGSAGGLWHGFIVAGAIK